jgi:hypothetical protein
MESQRAAVARGVSLLLRAYVGTLLFVPRLMCVAAFMPELR